VKIYDLLLPNLNNNLIMKDYEIEFYAHLGLLSVRFAKLEFKLSTILGKLLDPKDDLIPTLITENNSLSKNIELLKKLNRVRNFHHALVSNLTSQISKIQNDRNLFIHGIWSDPIINENSIQIICEERKIRYNDEKDYEGNFVEQTWHLNKNHPFNLDDIKNRIKVIDNIVELEDKLLTELEDENNDHFI
jgi:hypothetical protein